MTAYNDGRRLYDLGRRVDHADNQIAARQREIDSLDVRLDAHEDAIVSGDMNHFERARLLLEAKDMIDERKDLEHEIERLESERVVYQRELDDYRQTVAYVSR
jgi:predicted  nucleic acid-binding Zn-ribbon protein